MSSAFPMRGRGAGAGREWKALRVDLGPLGHELPQHEGEEHARDGDRDRWHGVGGCCEVDHAAQIETIGGE